MSDSFEFTLHSPLTKEDWNKISDAEHENTMYVTFQTPQGKQVRYIKCEVLDKIRDEITDCLKALDEIEKSELNIYLPNEILGRRLTYQQCLGFIDKYKAERISDDLSCDDMAENGLCILCEDKDQCAADIDELSMEIVGEEQA